jgi:hypothetical protein
MSEYLGTVCTCTSTIFNQSVECGVPGGTSTCTVAVQVVSARRNSDLNRIVMQKG